MFLWMNVLFHAKCKIRLGIRSGMRDFWEFVIEFTSQSHSVPFQLNRPREASRLDYHELSLRSRRPQPQRGPEAKATTHEENIEAQVFRRQGQALRPNMPLICICLHLSI